MLPAGRLPGLACLCTRPLLSLQPPAQATSQWPPKRAEHELQELNRLLLLVPVNQHWTIFCCDVSVTVLFRVGNFQFAMETAYKGNTQYQVFDTNISLPEFAEQGTAPTDSMWLHHAACMLQHSVLHECCGGGTD